MKDTLGRDWDVEDAEEIMQDKIGRLKARVEQLEAEVESWKNSYERERKEKDDLAVRLEVAQHVPEE